MEALAQKVVQAFVVLPNKNSVQPFVAKDVSARMDMCWTPEAIVYHGPNVLVKNMSILIL